VESQTCIRAKPDRFCYWRQAFCILKISSVQRSFPCRLEGRHRTMLTVAEDTPAAFGEEQLSPVSDT